MFTFPFFLSSFFLFFLKFLISLQLFCLFRSCVDHIVEFFQNKADNVFGVEISRVGNWISSVISIKRKGLVRTFNGNNLEEAIKSIINSLKNILIFSRTYLIYNVPDLWTSHIFFPLSISCSNSSSENEMTEMELTVTRRTQSATKIFIILYV